MQATNLLSTPKINSAPLWTQHHFNEQETTIDHQAMKRYQEQQ